MNQNRLQEKRRKRQAKRKQAQATARRRNAAEREARDHAVAQMRKAKPVPVKPGFLASLLGAGVPVSGEQMDAEPAPLVSGDSR
jgi:hypothetical protein